MLRDTALPIDLTSCTFTHTPKPTHALQSLQGQPKLFSYSSFCKQPLSSRSPQRHSTPKATSSPRLLSVLLICMSLSRLPHPLPGYLLMRVLLSVLPMGLVQSVAHRKYQNTCVLSSIHSSGYSQHGMNPHRAPLGIMRCAGNA